MTTMTKTKRTVADYPQLVLEFHPTKNGSLLPTDFLHGSKKACWWQCTTNKTHSWEASPLKRKQSNRGCPYCNKLGVTDENRLITRRPDLLEEWDYEKNGELTPSTVSYGSEIKAWWICKNGHSYQQRIRSKHAGIGCHYCSGHRVNESNCLKTLRPSIAKEWHYTKNGHTTPEHVVEHSNFLAWWICEKGHEYQSRVYHRSNGKGCGICNRASKSENAIAKILDNYSIPHKREYQNKKCKYKKLLRFDFAIFETKTNNLLGVIEYHGEQHFRPKFKFTQEWVNIQKIRDQIKRDFCAAEGIPLLEITDESQIESQVTTFLIQLGLIN